MKGVTVLGGKTKAIYSRLWSSSDLWRTFPGGGTMDAATKPVLIPSRTHYREAQADGSAGETQRDVASVGAGAASEALLLRN